MDALTRHWREVFDPARLEYGRQLQQQMRPPAQPCHHCWHPSVRAWAGSPPAPMHCCWCGEQTYLQAAMLHRHGPYAAGG